MNGGAMIQLFLTMPVWLKTIITIGIVLFLFLFYFFQRRLTKKSADDPPRIKVVLIYALDMVLSLSGIVMLLLVWSFDFTILSDDLWSDIEAFVLKQLGAIIGSVITVFVAMMILKISKIAFARFGKKPGPMQKRKRTIAKVTQSIIKYMVGIISVLIILALWGVNVLPALAGLGIMGLVIGLGAQKFINDLIAGLFIVFEQHFDVGDIIEVGGFKGEVTSIGLKTTKIRNWKGEVKILANGGISELTNFSLNPSVAIIDFGIAYHEDAKRTIELLKVELPKFRPNFPDMLEDPVVLGVIELGDSSVNLRVIAKTVSEKHYAIERDLRATIKDILDQNNIEIPFPQVVVHEAKAK